LFSAFTHAGHAAAQPPAEPVADAHALQLPPEPVAVSMSTSVNAQ
jgi:hypothetical protein